MPNYAQPLAVGGAAAGGGLTGALGRLLEPLDYARQALWNVPGKLLEGDFAGAAPGLAGLGVGAGLAATGVGLPLALLAGSLTGGVGQGIGKSVDEERFASPSASHLLEALGGDSESGPGMVGAMALNALGDPLTYAGGIGLGSKGAQAGRHLENVALTRGPRYPGGAEKLLFGAESATPEALSAAVGKHLPGMAQGDLDVFGKRLAALHQGPDLARLLQEVPPGSVPLGMGAEAMALKTEQGGALRIAGGPLALDVRTHMLNPPTAPSATISAQEVLQPARELPIGRYRVQHSPLVDVAPGYRSELHPMWQEMEEATGPLERALANGGLNPFDLHAGNVGRTRSGNYVVTDPGSVLHDLGQAAPEPFAHAQGGKITNFLLDLLGADKSVRREVQATLAKGGAGQGLAIPQAREVGDVMRRRIPDIMSEARASRDLAWQELLQAEGRAGHSTLNELVNNLGLQQAQVNDARVALSLPRQAIGTPLQPFLKPGQVSAHPLDLAEIANQLAASPLPRR